MREETKSESAAENAAESALIEAEKIHSSKKRRKRKTIPSAPFGTESQTQRYFGWRAKLKMVRLRSPSLSKVEGEKR
jgi:hypothetical protein